jgi:hypothetical protein
VQFNLEVGGKFLSLAALFSSNILRCKCAVFRWLRLTAIVIQYRWQHFGTKSDDGIDLELENPVKKRFGTRVPSRVPSNYKSLIHNDLRLQQWRQQDANRTFPSRRVRLGQHDSGTVQ